MHVPGSSPRRWIRSLLVILGCFAAILGAKLAYVDRAVMDLPNWDQWDAESEALLLPWLRGELTFGDLFKPHNEHRIAPTKALALGLFVANGQWDARLECVVNAVLQSLLALAFFLGGRRLVPERWHIAWLAGVLAFFAAPMSWQNATGGFHTQQTFLIGFSFATVLALVDARVGSLRWWAGMGFALASLVTMGSGLLAAVAAGATLVFVTPLKSVLRRHGLTIALLVAIAALGWFTRIEVSYHSSLHAQSPWAFLLCFWRSLQWPVTAFVLFPLLAWAPFTWLAWRLWTRKEDATPGLQVVFGAGLWALLQFAASAYARGGTGDWPAIRYLDTVAIGLAVNFLALLIACAELPLAGWKRTARLSASIIGLALLAHGWWMHIDDAINGTAPVLAREGVEKQARTRAYLRTGDMSHLQVGIIPYPGAESFAQRLAHEEIRAILPASVRQPVSLIAETGGAAVFSSDAIAPETPAPGGWPVLGSFTRDGSAATGEWRSALLPPAHARYWVLPVISSRSESAQLSLRVIDEAGRELTSVLPVAAGNLSHTKWHEVVIPAPRVPARLVATDGLGDGWLAFGAPTEMAAGSRWAQVLAHAGLVMFFLGCGLAVASLGARLDWYRALTDAGERERRRWRTMNRWRLGFGIVLGGGAAAFLFFLFALRIPPAFFEARVSGTLHKRSMELFFDRGRGIRGEDSVQVWFGEEETARHLRLRITPGRIKALRVDPMDHGATLTIENARIVDVNGATLRDLPPAAFAARLQVASLEREGGRLVVTSEPGALDSQLQVTLDPPVSTQPVSWHMGLRLLMLVFTAGLGALVGPTLIDRLMEALGAASRGRIDRLRRPPDDKPPRPPGTPRFRWKPGPRTTVLFVALAIVGVLAFRKTDSFVNPQLWAEDSTVFYLDAEMRGFGSLLKPHAGYLHTIPRLGALLGAQVDPQWIPFAFVHLSLAATLACALHLFSPRMLLPWKPLLAIAVVAVPHTGEIFLNLTNTQWFAGLLLLQMAIKEDWTRPRERVTDLTLIVLTGLTGPFCIAFVPVFAWRAWSRKSAPSWIAFATVVACALIQIGYLVDAHVSMTDARGALDLETLAGVVGRRWVFSLITAMHVPGGDPRLFVGLCSSVLLLGLLLVGLRRPTFRRADAVLWLAAGALLATSCYRIRFDQWAFVDTVNGDRYFVLPKIILLWLVVAAAHPRTIPGWICRLVLVIIFAVNLSTFRIPPQPDYRWRDYCDSLRQGQKVDIPVTPQGWIFQYPGRPH